jgi:hypothetical protein
MGASGAPERSMGGIGILLAAVCAVLAVPLLSALAPEVRALRASARAAPAAPRAQRAPGGAQEAACLRAAVSRVRKAALRCCAL